MEYLSLAKFYRRIKRLAVDAEKKGGEELKNKLRLKKKHYKDAVVLRQKIWLSLRLSRYAKNLIKIANLFGSWKDARKSGVYMGMHHFEKFLEEISRRRGLTTQQLNFLIYPEIVEVLKDKKDFSKEIRNRKQQAFFALTPKGYYIASGKKANAYFKYVAQNKPQQNTQIRGICACPGQVMGKVRVIRKTEDMKKFKLKEILVTNQTTPEFVPIMKKAAAIITEQGGITSHAAIVSRELGIPCVIGTRIATKALKDGDRVEVDAERGVVKKIQ